MANQIDIYNHKNLQFGKLSNNYPWRFRLGLRKEGNKWVPRIWETITNYIYSNMIIGRSGAKSVLVHVPPDNIHKEYKLALADSLRDEYLHVLGDMTNIIEFNTDTDAQARLLASTNGPISYISNDPILGVDKGIGQNVYGECLRRARMRLKELQKISAFRGANENLKTAFQYFKATKVAKDNIKAGDFTLELYKKRKGITGDVINNPLLLVKNEKDSSASAVWEPSDFSMFKELYLKKGLGAQSEVSNYVDFYMANPTLLVPTIQAIYAEESRLMSIAIFKRCLHLADTRNKLKSKLLKINPAVSEDEIDEALMQIETMLYEIETDDPNLIQARKKAYISQNYLYGIWLTGQIKVPPESMCIQPISQEEINVLTQRVESRLRQSNMSMASLKLDSDIERPGQPQFDNSPVLIGYDPKYNLLIPTNIRTRLANKDFNNLEYVFYAIKFTLLPTSSRQFEKYFNSPIAGLPLSISAVYHMIVSDSGTEFKTIPNIQTSYQMEYERFQHLYKIRLAQQALNLKFSMPIFAEILKTTEPDTIVWGDNQDNVLGTGPSGTGENWVGNYLMTLRKNISNTIAPNILTFDTLPLVLKNSNVVYSWVVSYINDIINAYFVTTACIQNPINKPPVLKYANLIATSFFCNISIVKNIPLPPVIDDYIRSVVFIYKQKGRDIPKSVIDVAWEFVVSTLMTWENEPVIDIISFIGSTREVMSRELSYTPIIQGEFENSILISLIAIMKKLKGLAILLKGKTSWIQLLTSAVNMILRPVTSVSLDTVSDQDIQLEDSDKCDCPNCRDIRRQKLGRPARDVSSSTRSRQDISELFSDAGDSDFQDNDDDYVSWAVSGSDNGRIDNGIRCTDVEKIRQSLLSSQIVEIQDAADMTLLVRRAISYIMKYRMDRNLKRIRINYFTGTISIR
jgi:hypothetical protein